MSNQRHHEAYLQLDRALRDGQQAARLERAVQARLRQLAGRLLSVPHDGDALVQEAAALLQEAAALLSGQVAGGALSDETADQLWLDLAACAAARRFTSRPAAEASIS